MQFFKRCLLNAHKGHRTEVDSIRIGSSGSAAAFPAKLYKYGTQGVGIVGDIRKGLESNSFLFASRDYESKTGT